MGKRRRQASEVSWEQLELLMSSDEQRTYELIRPIVLFGQPPIERAAEANTPAHTLRRRAQRFEEQGMASLFEPGVWRRRGGTPAGESVAVCRKYEHRGGRAVIGALHGEDDERR